MITRRRLAGRPLVALAIAVCCTLVSGAQVQLPTVSHPIKSIFSIAITRDGGQVVLVTLASIRASWIVAQPLDGGASRVLVPSGSHARYVPSKGVLVYRMTGRGLDPSSFPLAVAPFDPPRFG
jgi:hypothetical protein